MLRKFSRDDSNGDEKNIRILIRKTPYFLDNKEALVLDSFNQNKNNTIPSISMKARLSPSDARKGIDGLIHKGFIVPSTGVHIKLTSEGKQAARNLRQSNPNVFFAQS